MVNVQPGVPLTAEDKAKLAIENQKESEQAHQLAKEAQEAAHLGGEKPVLTSVADSIKDKLKNEEFFVHEETDPRPQL